MSEKKGWNTTGRIDLSKIKLEEVVEEEVEKNNEMCEYEEPDWEQPSDSHEYIVAVGLAGTAIFLDTPLIHDSFFENGRDQLDDNGFAIPEDLCAGVYKMRFHFFSSKDWETGYVDDWGFDCIGEPELLYEYEDLYKNTDNI